MPLAPLAPVDGLFGWLATIPGARIGPVTLGTSGIGSGRGLYLSRAVEKGEFLFAVPRPRRVAKVGGMGC